MSVILYIGGFELPNKNAAAQRVLSNAKLFRDTGNEVVLIGLSKDAVKIEHFTFEGFCCYNLPYPHSITQWYEYLLTIKWYESFLSSMSPNIVIAYNHPAIALNKLLLYNRKHRIITLSDCTEWYEPQGNLLFRLIKGWDVNHRMYNVHCKLDGIITISRYLDDFYKQRGMKTLLLPPLVDIHETKWQKESHNYDKDIKLIYAGSPAGTKDRLDFMIESLNEVAMQGRNFEFNIVGITEDEYRKVYLNGLAASIPDFVHFYGRIPHENVIEMLKNSDFQIFLRENHLANNAGFPTKFAETISAGTIVLTNPSSNIKDYMLEGVNSFELDLSSKMTLVNTLFNPLSLSKEEIKHRKDKIDTSIFDYRKYTLETKDFLDSLYEKMA